MIVPKKNSQGNGSVYTVLLGRASVGMLSFLSLKRIYLKEKSHIYVQCGKTSFRAFISSSTRVLICENAYKCAEFTTPPSFSAGETIHVMTGNSFRLAQISLCMRDHGFLPSFREKATWQKYQRRYCKYFLSPSRRKINMLCRCWLVYKEENGANLKDGLYEAVLFELKKLVSYEYPSVSIYSPHPPTTVFDSTSTPRSRRHPVICSVICSLLCSRICSYLYLWW